MALTNNLLIRNASGLLGNQLVLRQRGEKTFLCNRPQVKKGRIPSVCEKANRDKFKLAVKYALEVINNPDLKARYARKAKPGQTAYNVAFSDAYQPPEISNLQTEDYQGHAGDKILVRVIDNFFVDNVRVSILDVNGELLEKGFASKTPNGRDWSYTVTRENAHLPGTLIRVTAEDLPKNRSILEKIL